jgi:hypothetical protein
MPPRADARIAVAACGLCLVLPLSVVPVRSLAQQAEPPCSEALAEVDRNVVQAMLRLLSIEAAPDEVRCAAILGQIEAITTARDVHVRCYPPGASLDALVAVLDTSVRDFQQAHTSLGCSSSAAVSAHFVAAA